MLFINELCATKRASIKTWYLSQTYKNLLGGIQVLRHQRGGWVVSENGNFL